MRKFAFSVIAICWFLCALTRLCAQAPPAASSGDLALSIGAGFSDYDVDWGHGRMLGGTLWLDYQPPALSGRFGGMGAEIEARDVSLRRSPSQPPNFREDSLGGGAIYTVDRFLHVRPYMKFLVSLGSMDFKVSNPYYSHDTRTVFAPGLGCKVPLTSRAQARFDYEYQFWPHLLGATSDPQGFTVGVAYGFGELGR